MERKPTQRRLAAVLAADVVGYSRLMSVDEMSTLTSLKAHRRELIDPAVAGHHGRIVKTTGDGALVEFGSVVDAVQCAVAIQRGMLSRNAGICEDKRIVFRIGVNVGDIIIDDGDIFGDGVNIAARLQTLCEPGGLCISRAANDQIRDKLAVAFADLGEQTVKNISRAIGVFGLAPTDIEALPEPQALQLEEYEGIGRGGRLAHGYQQEVQFCMTGDGVQLAYSRVGSGPPLVKTGNWMTHLEFDFESPIWRHLYRELSRDHSLIRYDARNNGLRTATSMRFRSRRSSATSKPSWMLPASNASRCSASRRDAQCRSPMRCAIPSASPIWLYTGGLLLALPSAPGPRRRRNRKRRS